MALAGLAGCSAPQVVTRPDTDADRIERHFDALNAAGRQSSEAQDEFLRDSQHPDFTDRLCELDGRTLDVYPALSTIRLDGDWAPEGGDPPSGSVYVVSVSTTIRQAGALVGEQIGAEHVAVLDGETFGFSPCPQGT